MAKRCLLTVARRELLRARNAPSGVSWKVLVEGDLARPDVAVVGLRAGSSVTPRHDATDLTVQVLSGRVKTRWRSGIMLGFPGDLLTGLAATSILAETDCVVLLTCTVSTTERQRPAEVPA